MSLLGRDINVKSWHSSVTPKMLTVTVLGYQITVWEPL